MTSGVRERGAGPVVVGSASRDLAPRDPRGWRLGGAVTYAGLALARLGLRPRVLVGADPDAAAASELELLRDAGAEVRVAALARSPVFDNREVGGVRAQVCLEPGDPLPVDAFPAAWRAATAWVFGPVADELPARWAEVPLPAAHVALGWQGLLRELPHGGPVRRRPPAPSPLVARADLVVVSRLDLEPGTDVAALGALLRRDATLVVTDGDLGGSVWRSDGTRAATVRRYPAIATAGVVDATGAGDAFLAGLVAARLGHPLAGSGRRGSDLRLAAALGSLTVEGPGVTAVPELTAVAARLRASLSGG
ncbi:MAG TPA: PfkB family carbohydrate kinase [Candidatus Limnocylindrales bacterium]|nr:PfkB family carbohydrate kinase [Candidatus Limnocylindrales bacterium]